MGRHAGRKPCSAGQGRKRLLRICLFSDRDRDQASDIVSHLETDGIACWVSYRDVPFGEDFQDAIVSAIEEASAMVLVVSGAANDSQEIRKELALASTQRLFVLPVRIENFEPTKGLKYQLATRQRIDLFEDRDKNMRLMVETLRKRVSN
jgi:TIR domain